MTLGELVKNGRMHSGHTLRSAAAILGVNFTYLSKIEHDATPAPSADLLHKMADLYGIDADTLFVAGHKVSPDLIEVLASDIRAVKALRSWMETSA